MRVSAMGLALLVCASSGGWAQQVSVNASPEAELESFETGFGAWEPQAFLADPDSIAWEWSVVRSQMQASHGAWSLEFTASGAYDDGTVWVERSLEFPAGGYKLSLQFDVWSLVDAELGTWEKIAYIGDHDPEQESDFMLVALEDRAGWTTYPLSTEVWLSSPGTIWFAVGLNIVFETTRTHYFDALEIGWTPISAVHGETWAGVKALFR